MATEIINDISICFDRRMIAKSIDYTIGNNLKGAIFTINSNILVNSYKDPGYKKILKTSFLNICDGSLVARSLGIITNQKFEAYPGPDFFMYYIKEKKFKHAFVGGSREILEKLKSRLSEIDPSINESLFLDLPFTTVSNFDFFSISKKINDHNPDFIWVSLGAPKQEIFSSILVKRLNRGLVVAVGAAFEFSTGYNSNKRCPRFLRRLNLEWMYRLIKQPAKTWKRLKMELFFMPIVLLKEVIKRW